MRKGLPAICLVLSLSISACTSTATSSKQLDESSARRMVANDLSTKQYEISLRQLLPYLVIFHSKDDYRTGHVGPYGPLLKQLLAHGFITQAVHTTTYPVISGTFARCAVPNCSQGLKDEWILHSVPGTNQLQGQAVWQASYTTRYQGRGTIEPDGAFNLSCITTTAWTCDDQGQGQYYEKGGKGYLKFDHYAYAWNGIPYVGPATGRKLTATWYTYALTPKFTVLMHNGPAGRYVLGGSIVVGDVTNLRLDTQTLASANFRWSVSLNDAGRLVWLGNPPNGVGRAIFGKKPDQTWVLDSVADVPNLGP